MSIVLRLCVGPSHERVWGLLVVVPGMDGELFPGVVSLESMWFGLSGFGASDVCCLGGGLISLVSFRGGDGHTHTQDKSLKQGQLTPTLRLSLTSHQKKKTANKKTHPSAVHKDQRQPSYTIASPRKKTANGRGTTNQTDQASDFVNFISVQSQTGLWL